MESENASDFRDDMEGEEKDISIKSSCREEEYDDDEDETFILWLTNVTECLRGFRKADPLSFHPRIDLFIYIKVGGIYSSSDTITIPQAIFKSTIILP